MIDPGAPDVTPELVARASRGDGDAVEELLVDELPRLRAFVRLNVDSLLRARESCSDLVQSVCREVLGGLPAFEFRSVPQFRGWLYAWTLNKIRDRRKHVLAQKRDPRHEVAMRSAEAVAAVLSPSQQAVQREQLETIERAFDRLSPAQREVLALSRIAGLSHAEIAERTGRQPGAVRVLVHRALARLSSLLAADGGSR